MLCDRDLKFIMRYGIVLRKSRLFLINRLKLWSENSFRNSFLSLCAAFFYLPFFLSIRDFVSEYGTEFCVHTEHIVFKHSDYWWQWQGRQQSSSPPPPHWNDDNCSYCWFVVAFFFGIFMIMIETNMRLMCRESVILGVFKCVLLQAACHMCLSLWRTLSLSLSCYIALRQKTTHFAMESERMRNEKNNTNQCQSNPPTHQPVLPANT